MLDRDYRDVVAGLGLTAMGLATAGYALMHYRMGTVTRMGPGMMPTSLGVILAVFGLMIAVPALSRKGSRATIRYRVLIVLSASILAFAVMIEKVGLVPSIFATTVIATFAEREVPIVPAMILGAAMSFLTWAIFVAGLGLTIPSMAWPF